MVYISLKNSCDVGISDNSELIFQHTDGNNEVHRVSLGDYSVNDLTFLQEQIERLKLHAK